MWVFDSLAFVVMSDYEKWSSELMSVAQYYIETARPVYCGPTMQYYNALKLYIQGALQDVLIKDLQLLTLEFIITRTSLSSESVFTGRHFRTLDRYHGNETNICDVQVASCATDDGGYLRDASGDVSVVRVHWSGWKELYDFYDTPSNLLKTVIITENDLFEDVNPMYNITAANIEMLLQTYIADGYHVWVIDDCARKCPARFVEYKFVCEMPFVLVSYIGWPSTNDQWFCAWSNRIMFKE